MARPLLWCLPPVAPRSSLRTLLARVDRLLGQSETLRRRIDDAATRSHKALAGSTYGRLQRERDPFDPEVGELARALRLRRLLGKPPAT